LETNTSPLFLFFKTRFKYATIDINIANAEVKTIANILKLLANERRANQPACFNDHLEKALNFLAFILFFEGKQFKRK